MNIIIEREEFSDNQILGTLYLIDNEEVILTLKTLELSYRENQKRISSVPVGDYFLKNYSSPKYPNVLEIVGVENRNYILIHNGNYFTQTMGCVLVGLKTKDINGDGILDVVNSKTALKRLMLLSLLLTYIIFLIGIYFKIDPIALGTGLTMINSPLYVYIFGETKRKSK